MYIYFVLLHTTTIRESYYCWTVQEQLAIGMSSAGLDVHCRAKYFLTREYKQSIFLTSEYKQIIFLSSECKRSIFLTSEYKRSIFLTSEYKQSIFLTSECKRKRVTSDVSNLKSTCSLC